MEQRQPSKSASGQSKTAEDGNANGRLKIDAKMCKSGEHNEPNNSHDRDSKSIYRCRSRSKEYARQKLREFRQRQKEEDHRVTLTLQSLRDRNRELVFGAKRRGIRLADVYKDPFKRPDYPLHIQNKTHEPRTKRSIAKSSKVREARVKKSNAESQARCHKRRDWDRKYNYAEIEYLQTLNRALEAIIAAWRVKSKFQTATTSNKA